MEASNKIVPSIVVYVTVPNKDLGIKLAGSIVKEKLAACVNRLITFLIVPGVESVYEWQGEIQTDSEELLIIKTRESLLEALTEHVKANHEYDAPEVIAMPIVGGSPQYLEWLKNSTRDK
ncbi:Protein CutA, chloroplastic [Capsicum annuum]|uniref:Protein CutA, chloroplastic n=1 Tax=Capsicum annuum TaxID=4072 RepID=A0A2G2ZQS4_CAPAN|nr:Protein CutA, chloroplastic [Capsicum annuum]